MRFYMHIFAFLPLWEFPGDMLMAVPAQVEANLIKMKLKSGGIKRGIMYPFVPKNVAIPYKETHGSK